MKKLTLLGIFLALMSIGLYLSTSSNETQADAQQAPEVKIEITEPVNGVISLKAEMWEYNPNIIRLKKGQPVTIDLNNIDFEHGIIIPNLEIGGMETLSFTPEEAGEFEFFCPTYCGAGHGNMRGKIIVE